MDLTKFGGLLIMDRQVHSLQYIRLLQQNVIYHQQLLWSWTN